MPTYGQFQKKPASQSAPTSFFTPQLFQSRPFREPTIAPPPEASIQTRSNDERDSNGNPTWWSRLQFSSSTAVQPKLNISAPKDQQEQESEAPTETLGDRTTVPDTNVPSATIQASGYSEGAKARPNALDIMIRNLDAKQAAASARPVQPKLTIGQPNDQYEQEADRVADEVVSMPDRSTQQSIQRETAPEEDELQTKPIAASITPLVQRESMPEEEEVQTKSLDTVQREEMPEEEEVQTKAIASIQREEMPEEEVQTKPLGTVQREEMPEEEEVQTKSSLQRATEGSLQADSSIESRLDSSKGGGSPLSDEVRSFMEPRFGADFSQVRVHTGSEAVQMNRDLSAQAFTHKQDVYFGAGKAPGKDALTAHELTHVVQQTGSLNRKCSACQEEDSQIMRKETAASSASTSLGSNASESSSTTSQLQNLIARLEQLHAHSDEHIGAQANTESADSIPLQKEGQQHLDTLANGLEQLRTVAQSDDETLKKRVLAGFVPPAMQAAQAEASKQIQAGSGSSLQASSTAIVQRAPIGIAAKPLAVNSSQDATEVEADRVAKSVISDESLTINHQTPDESINRFAGADDLIAAGTALLIADAEAAPVEAATGPPGWVIGVGVAVAGVALIGIGYALSSSNDSEPITTPAPAPEPSATPAPIPVPIPVPAPQTRRWPNQTCEDNVLDQLQAEMHRICDAIPGDSCSPSKVSQKKLDRRPCSAIRTRIAALKACLAARQRIQDECFGSQPDPRHAQAIQEITNAIQACEALEAINCAPGHPMANL
jgi:hypothetical protein